MELVSVKRAAVLLYLQLERTNPHLKAWKRELAKLLVERYTFLKFPQTHEEFDEEEGGIAFAAGEFDGIEIVELKIFPNGLLLATGQSTETAERLFADMLPLWRRVGLILSHELVTKTTYVSQVVIHSDIDLLLMSSPIAGVIENWFPCGSGVISVGIYTDGNVNDPPLIRIERYAREPREAMQFWAQAPLSTPLHLTLLTRWETVVRESIASSSEPAKQP